MAKPIMQSGLPDAITRREILAGNPKFKTDLAALGAKYLAAGRHSDAIDCFERSKSLDKLGEVKAAAVESDVFLLTRLERIEGLEVSAADWRKAAESAERGGRDRSAMIAWERAGDEEKARAAKNRVEEHRATLEPPKKGRGGLSIG